MAWGFLTNHALVLIHVANHPSSTLREIATAVGVTERATLSILRAIEEDGIISRTKVGRNMRYSVDYSALLEHQLPGPYSVQELVENISAIAQNLQRWARRDDDGDNDDDDGGDDGDDNDNDDNDDDEEES